MATDTCSAITASGEPCSRACAEDSEYCWQHDQQLNQNKEKKLIERVRSRYKVMYEADHQNRDWAIEDLRFVNIPGEMWDRNMKQERGDRPCLEFNKLRINGKRVINEIRANRPQGKVRAVEGGDKDVAELYEGLCRNIWNISDGDTIIDNAAEYQVDAGMGAWRVVTEYSTGSSFDQDILLKPIKNPFCLYADPACDDFMKRDAADWILTTKMSNDAFDAKYGKDARSNFEDLGTYDDQDDWNDEEYVRVAEYWWKEIEDLEIWKVQFPPSEDKPEGEVRVVDSTTDEARGIDPMQIIGRRTIKCPKIKMCIASGQKILEGPVDWPGKNFPFVMVYGECKVVEGEFRWWGLHRFAKDAQKAYNVNRTAAVERVAGAPKEYFWATPGQAEGLAESWDEAHRKNYPYKLYNPDPTAPGPPSPVVASDIPTPLLQLSAVDSQDIRDVTGLHEASFGEESNEKSGIALARKQAQGEVVTYNFPDNMAKGIRRTWEILIDLIPQIYDAERELRVIGSDGAEDYRRVNELVYDPATGQTTRVNDLSVGHYDVTITTGPSFVTQRQEAAEVYGEIATRNPMFWELCGDLIAKSMDLPYSEDIAERLQLMLPAPIQKLIGEGKDVTPEALAVMAQAEQVMAQAEQHGQLVAQAAQELEGEKADAEKAKAEIRSAISDLRRQQAEFRATVAEKMADLRIMEARLDQQVQDVNEDRSDLDDVRTAVQNANDTIQAFDELVATYIDAAAQKMQALGDEVAKPKPKLKGAKIVRENGQTLAVMEMDDGTVKKLAASRGKDGLVATPVE